MSTTVERDASAVAAAAHAQAADAARPWRLWLLLGGLTLAYVPLLWGHAIQLWLRSHYQFFPLALAGAAWLSIVRCRGLGPLSGGQPGLSLLALGLCWLALAAAVVLHSPWLAAASLPPMLAALAYACGGSALLRRLLPALALLAIVVPPPLELDRSLVMLLQRFTTHWAGYFLDLLGVYHVMAGNVVEVGGERLLVEEACSGINSLFVVVACTLFFIFHERRPAFWSVLLLTSAVAWVLLANVARVVLLTVCKVRYQVDLTSGWKHDAPGFALFGVALLLLWSTDRLLRFLFEPSEPAPESSPVESPAAGPATTFPQLSASPATSWLPIGAVFLLAVVQLDAYRAGPGNEAAPPPSAGLEALTEQTLPARFGRWERQGFATQTRNPGSYFGEVSKIWSYHLGKNAAVFSLDYPFANWHDLTRCYTGQGWVVAAQAVHPAREEPSKRDGFVEVVLTKPTYREGHLLFSQYDRHAQALPPRPGGPDLALYRHTTTLERWRRRLGGQAAPTEKELPPIYQAQLFIETYTPLTPREQEEAHAFFHAALPRVLQHVSGGRATP